MKKWKAVITACIVTIFMALCVGCSAKPPDDGAKRESITYTASAAGLEYPLPESLFLEDGNYPKTYVCGEESTISPLKNSCVDGQYEYTFHGWYWDVSCTQPFEKIPETSETPVVLYAKLSIVGWSGRL
ncbi:MAG: hypothetical protein IJY11_02400 [Clostridia bacterium]|nr:hypothetical protein [Clostridia bacterium]